MTREVIAYFVRFSDIRALSSSLVILALTNVLLILLSKKGSLLVILIFTIKQASYSFNLFSRRDQFKFTVNAFLMSSNIQNLSCYRDSLIIRYFLL